MENNLIEVWNGNFSYLGKASWFEKIDWREVFGIVLVSAFVITIFRMI